MRVDPFYVQSLAGSLSDTTATEAQLSGELSSGLRISSLSDDPAAAARSTLLSASISADDSYVQAASTTESKLQISSSALGEVVTQLTQAVSLAVSGGNGTLDASQKSVIGSQLSHIQQQVLALANTTYLGQYVFGGSVGSTAAFTQNTNGASAATTTYNGDAVLQYTTTSNGQKIQTNVAGSDIFNASGSSVFLALNRAVADFNAGADADTLGLDSSAITSALKTVSKQQSIIDTSLSQLQSTSTYAQTDEAQLEASQSALVAVNTAQVATQLSGAETQGSALSSVIATLEKGSLFDYLK